MPADNDSIRAALREACSRHLWMPLPKDLEDAVVDAAAAMPACDINASPYGELFCLAVSMAHQCHGYGTFVTVYDDEVTLSPASHPEALADGDTGTYRKI